MMDELKPNEMFSKEKLNNSQKKKSFFSLFLFSATSLANAY